MKRKVLNGHIHETFACLFKDMQMWSKTTIDYARDFERIETLLETRGDLRVALVDLPGYAKSFDLALSRNNADLLEMPLLGSSRGIPPFMRQDFEDIFDNVTGRLLESPSADAVRNIRQVLLLFKKSIVECTKETVDETIQQYYAVDRSLREPLHDWSVVLPEWSRSVALTDVRFDGDETPRCIIEMAQAIFDVQVSSFPELRCDDLVGQHGPGSVSDSKRDADKYRFPTWSDRLDAVFPYSHHTSPNYSTFVEYLREGTDANELHKDLPAKLIAVAKTFDKPRLIASEPTANQFIQGAMRKYLVNAVSTTSLRFSVDIRKQQLSQTMAKQASCDSSLATVDLKDASDRLTMWFLERALRSRPDLLTALAACRSVQLTSNSEPTPYTLRKYAPQGNATVFPLQSACYALLAIAALAWVEKRAPSLKTIKQLSRRVRVFGDDIILPTTALTPLSFLLKSCQLVINTKKTHFSGNFAESCGFDGFRGEEVTPCYVRHLGEARTPDSINSCVEVSNTFHRRGLIRTANLISGWIVKHDLNRIMQSQHKPDGYVANESERKPMRLHAFCPRPLITKWNADLQREVVQDLVLTTKVNRVERDDWLSLTQYCIEAPSAETNWSSGWNTASKTRLRLARD